MNWRPVLFTFNGRIARQTFWIALSALALVMLGVSFPIGDLLSLAELPTAWRLHLAGLAMTYPASAVLVKRLHDRNKSGRWVLLLLAPFAVLAAGQATQLSGEWKDVYGHPVFDPNVVGFGIIAVAFAAVAWAAVELGCLRGVAGPNRFGADPLSPAR